MSKTGGVASDLSESSKLLKIDICGQHAEKTVRQTNKKCCHLGIPTNLLVAQAFSAKQISERRRPPDMPRTYVPGSGPSPSRAALPTMRSQGVVGLARREYSRWCARSKCKDEAAQAVCVPCAGGALHATAVATVQAAPIPQSSCASVIPRHASVQCVPVAQSHGQCLIYSPDRNVLFLTSTGKVHFFQCEHMCCIPL